MGSIFCEGKSSTCNPHLCDHWLAERSEGVVEGTSLASQNEFNLWCSGLPRASKAEMLQLQVSREAQESGSNPFRKQPQHGPLTGPLSPRRTHPPPFFAVIPTEYLPPRCTFFLLIDYHGADLSTTARARASASIGLLSTRILVRIWQPDEPQKATSPPHTPQKITLRDTGPTCERSVFSDQSRRSGCLRSMRQSGILRRCLGTLEVLASQLSFVN